MSDLSSYSIVHNSQCSTTPNTFAKYQTQQISLPPLSSLLPPIHHYHYHNSNEVILPPPSTFTSNYTTKPILSGSITPTQNYHNLTESNLIKLDPSPNHHGLGLLTSAISSLPSSASSSSLVSMSSTPASSPIMKARTKRRQRLGPSCDSCRLRKVKCDADITIVIKQNGLQSVPDYYPNLVSDEQLRLLGQGQSITIDNEFNLIVTNDKLIKFKSCHSCTLKQLPCCFSKGFTKEDIMNNKRSSSSSITVAPPVIKKSKPVIKKKAVEKKSAIIQNIAQPQQSKPITPVIVVAPVKSELSDEQFVAGRKSSCGSCRKRKVRCVFNATLNKCEGCNKKKSDCVYDKQK
ncbi:Sterol uptake protein 2 [Spathaspora sp. JA1]|nr:Sterol uptake protein 2 [Spathaspora sp. JA1]